MDKDNLKENMENERDEVAEEVQEEVQEEIFDGEPVDGDVVEETEEDVSEKYQDLNDKYVRLQADYINYKRRTSNERAQALSMGVEKMAFGLLDIVDNFERALSLEKDTAGSFYEGVEMIYTQLIDYLKQNGVVEIDALNQKFDPNFHHAVMVEERDDVESGIVTEVFQKGYMIDERVLRPSMVKVSK